VCMCECVCVCVCKCVWIFFVCECVHDSATDNEHGWQQLLTLLVRVFTCVQMWDSMWLCVSGLVWIRICKAERETNTMLRVCRACAAYIIYCTYNSQGKKLNVLHNLHTQAHAVLALLSNVNKTTSHSNGSWTNIIFHPSHIIFTYTTQLFYPLFQHSACVCVYMCVFVITHNSNMNEWARVMLTHNSAAPRRKRRSGHQS